MWLSHRNNPARGIFPAPHSYRYMDTRDARGDVKATGGGRQLLYRYRLGQVSWKIHVRAVHDGDVVGQELEWDIKEKRAEL